MANLPSTFDYVNDIEVAQDAPITESLNQKYGSNDNYLKDTTDDHETRVAALETDVATIQGSVPNIVKGAYSGTVFFGNPAANLVSSASITVAAGKSVRVWAEYNDGTVVITGVNMVLQVFRDAVLINSIKTAASGGFQHNLAPSLEVSDTPGTGAFTYSIKAISLDGPGGVNNYVVAMRIALAEIKY